MSWNPPYQFYLLKSCTTHLSLAWPEFSSSSPLTLSGGLVLLGLHIWHFVLPPSRKIIKGGPFFWAGALHIQASSQASESLPACLVVSDSLQPLHCSLPGSPVHEIFQARILEWVDISFFRGSSWPRDWTSVSCISRIAGRFFTTVPSGKPKQVLLTSLTSMLV